MITKVDNQVFNLKSDYPPFSIKINFSIFTTLLLGICQCFKLSMIVPLTSIPRKSLFIKYDYIVWEICILQCIILSNERPGDLQMRCENKGLEIG